MGSYDGAETCELVGIYMLSLSWVWVKIELIKFESPKYDFSHFFFFTPFFITIIIVAFYDFCG